MWARVKGSSKLWKHTFVGTYARGTGRAAPPAGWESDVGPLPVWERAVRCSLDAERPARPLRVTEKAGQSGREAAFAPLPVQGHFDFTGGYGYLILSYVWVK